MDEFTTAYIEAALWSSMDNANDEPLDANYGVDDFAPEALASIKEDCEAFQRDHADDIAGNLESAGHDFWLTRNGHGAGFWDGDWEKDAAKRLTDASHVYGGVDIYVRDDGRLYI